MCVQSSILSSHIVLDGVTATCGCLGQCVPTRGEPVSMGWRACAQNGSPTEQQPRCHKTYVYGCSELSLHHLRDSRVVEIPDDGVGGPRNRNYRGESCQAEDCSRAQHHPSFDLWVAQAVGAACPQKKDKERQTSQNQADANKATGCLEVWRQVQKSIVELTLHLTCVFTDTGHPQTLPEHLHNHQMSANECCHLPHGQSTDQNGPSDTGH